MVSRRALVWVGLLVAVVAPLIAATQSPLLQWREPIYVVAGFAGIVGLALLLVQPLLIAGLMRGGAMRQTHLICGMALVVAVLIHVVGLWITSPPDVIDVLLFRSPTPFAIWGALAMWAVFAAALLAVFRRRIGPRVWRLGHSVAISVVVSGTVVHAWLIEGAMETVTKGLLCAAALAASVLALRKRRVWRLLR